MRKIRFARQFSILFVKRFGFIILVGVLLGGAFFVLYDKIKATFSGFSKEERIGVVGRFTPDTLPTPILSLISSGLTTLSEDNEPQPGIAKRWEIREEGRVWSFAIRENLKWQDGSLVESTDIKYSFPDVQVSYPDKQTIEFRLPDPYSPFPVVVSYPVFKKGLLGVGAWRARKTITSGGPIEELALENYTSGERVLYRFYPTEQSIISAFKLGEIDVIWDISETKKLEKWTDLKIEKVVHKDRFVGIFLNIEHPLFKEKEFRQALSYAIRKEGRRALSSISYLSWAYNMLVKPYEYNPSRARELLSELPKEQREQLTISLVTIPSLLETAEKIKKDWEEVGVKTNVQVGTGVPENFEALLATQIIPPDPDQYSMWHSTQGETNITHYKDPRIDKLLEDGRRELDQEKRKRIYIDFQRFLVEDSPVIFLYYPETFTVSRR